MPTFNSKDVTLYYEEEGTGSPLILLHGMSGNLGIFTKEREQLRNQYRLIALDSRGHGKSDRPEIFTLDDHIQDVIALMDHLEIGKAHILGVSMGSYIAQGIATQYAERVDKLILVVSKAYGKISPIMELFARHAEELENLNDQEKMAAMSKYIFYNLTAVAEWSLTIPKSIDLTPEQQLAASKALEGFDFRAVLPNVRATTLVISGKHDGLNSPEKGKEVASLIPNSAYVEFEKSGHMPSVEEHNLFIETLTNFLKNKDVLH